jgi:hypothetical protein
MAMLGMLIKRKDNFDFLEDLLHSIISQRRVIMISVYDFFSGCGGASKGFQDANLEIRLGIDNDPDAANTFRKNFPSASFIEKDIRDIKCKDCYPDGRLVYLNQNCPICKCPLITNNHNTEVSVRHTCGHIYCIACTQNILNQKCPICQQ